MAITAESFMPDLSGQVALVTGFGTSIELARKGARVYIAGRSESKYQDTVQTIIAEYPAADVRFLPVDLMDLGSVSRAAEIVMQQESRLHLLVNNAGVMCTPYEETKDGFEMHIAFADDSVAGTVRIVNVSSDGHEKLAPKRGIIFEDANLKGDYSVWTRYGHSKLANVLYTKELAKRYPNILSFSVHPGTVKTNLSQGPLASIPLYHFVKPLVELGAPGPRKGAANILYAAVSGSLSSSDNGSYFLPVGKMINASRSGEDLQMAHKLWGWTEEEMRSRGY
ncbi:NAD(P)-binding protein [Aspergillus sclerotioniger CBS 115572]|uniref:NAD(P)-binding protein n=1 Tax=Aspergillus sclerotioniger CBS 115572 TaxID=1450535 RepID=A0A317XFA0_9EURO|nr:NAD(P)-binding protein [Aspergillus sclerotioniger CBS 115572]PWY96492.1 NAD(P)-binding protein [Aspergillus sclerotioniger CBS 115572]